VRGVKPLGNYGGGHEHGLSREKCPNHSGGDFGGVREALINQVDCDDLPE
jgi:hypothetical protein